MGSFDEIYAKLPVHYQHLAVSTFGFYWRWLRFGYGYDKALKGYMEREHYTASDWEVWKAVQLGKLLRNVLSVPFYQQNWTHIQKKGAQEGCLSALPLLEKDPIRKSPIEFLRTDLHPVSKLTFYTSGSTGTPIAAIYTIAELRDSIALREARSARWAGVSFQDPRATFSGRLVEPDPESKGPYYRFNMAEHQVYFSPFHLRPDNAHLYVKALTKHRIRWLTGYAVSYYLLAKFMLEKGIAPPASVRAIITTSEKVLPEMRETMEKAFQCKVYEEYSSVENAVFASECEKGKLHVSPDVAVVEILRPDGTACLPGEAGEVVVTSLTRTYQPLIRYRIGDVAMWDPEPCPCGRQMPVLKEIIGRIEDVVIGPDGRQMVRFHGVFVNQPHVREGQIIQDALDLIRVKVVPSDGFGELDVIDITHRIQQRLGKEVKVQVETVPTIPRTKAGKFQAVVSNLKS